jgi:hypothetical protein
MGWERGRNGMGEREGGRALCTTLDTYNLYCNHIFIFSDVKALQIFVDYLCPAKSDIMVALPLSLIKVYFWIRLLQHTIELFYKSPDKPSIKKKLQPRKAQVNFWNRFLQHTIKLFYKPPDTLFIKKKQQPSKAKVSFIVKNTNRESISWFHHSCLYGHKDNLKKIITKFKDDIDVNSVSIKGNTGLHLAIEGGHFSIVQILLSTFKNDINLTSTNDDGHNAIDLAVVYYRRDILNLLLKNKLPKVSSLIVAIKCNHSDLATIIYDKLQKMFEDDISLKPMFDRYFELNKEVDNKSITEERLEICQRNIEAYVTIICNCLVNKHTLSSHPAELKESTNPGKFTTDKKVSDEFECPVCFEQMISPKKIYSCSNDHYICSICLADPKITHCPQCREDFAIITPTRRISSERIARLLLQQQTK